MDEQILVKKSELKSLQDNYQLSIKARKELEEKVADLEKQLNNLKNETTHV